MAKTYTVILSDAEDKALAWVAKDNQAWIDNAVRTRCRIAIEDIVAAEVKRKIEAGEAISGSKEEIVLAADLLSAAQRDEQLTQANIASQGA